MITKEEAQRIWDTCLLETWRSDSKLMVTVAKFNERAGVKLTEMELRRVPPFGFPWTVGVRVFVHERLEKISNRMWNMPPERDAALIEKLQTSTYDTANQNLNRDNDLALEKRHDKKNREKLMLDSRNYSRRNQKTDWSTVK
jgi:hypothetical protein